MTHIGVFLPKDDEYVLVSTQRDVKTPKNDEKRRF